jgi:hypothetical protein
MSATTESVNVQVEVKPKAPRKPTLPAKYSKMLVFGYSLVESLRAKGLFDDELVEQLFSELHLMSPLDDQIAYYDNVLSQASANAKVMKKFVADKNKPVKEPKVRKPRAKKAVTVKSDASDDDVIQNLVDAARDVSEAPVAEKKEKKPKKEKKVVEVPVAEAPVVLETPVVKEKKAKKEKKVVEAPVVQTPVVEAPVVQAPVVQETKKEKKAKAKKDKKEKKAEVPLPLPVPVADNDDVDDDDEEIVTKETLIDGQTFLIDQNNNLYHPISHEFIRTI